MANPNSSQPLDPASPAPSKPLDTKAAAEIVGLAPKTLVKMRCYGGGPVFEKNGRRVVYDIEDLRAWRRQNKRRSTSDPGPGGER
jgi:hypothetical protein